jgi:hypothetical protein
MLQLNNPREEDRFKVFYGRGSEQMPALIESGRVPLSTVDIMKKRIDVYDVDNHYSPTCNVWWANHFDTADGILYHPNGKIKVVQNARFLRELTADTSLLEGAIVLDTNREKSIATYNSIDGIEFTRDQVSQDPENTVWFALAKDNQDLLDSYRSSLIGQLQESKTPYMRVHLAKAQEVATGRMLAIQGRHFKSDIEGSFLIDQGFTHLVGVKSN